MEYPIIIFLEDNGIDFQEYYGDVIAPKFSKKYCTTVV